MKKLFAIAALVLGITAAPLVVATSVGAASADQTQCEAVGGTWSGDVCSSGSGGTIEGFLSTVVNVLLFIIGAVSVVMIIVGGIRYVISGGDQQAVTSAKNTIMYAVIGLVVALLGYAAVSFIISAF